MPNYEEYSRFLLKLDNAIISLFFVGLAGILLLWRIYPMLSPYVPRIPSIPWDWFTIICLALVFRLPALITSFWYDESFSGALVQLDFDQLHHIIMSDVHPPLAYLMLWISSRILGDSMIALRLPSLAFGLLSLWLIYRVTLQFRFSRDAALMAAAIVAILPVHQFYSVEARGYTLMLCVGLWMVIAILRNRSDWFLASCLLAFIHAQGFIYIAVLGIAALAYHRSWRWLFSVGFAGAVASIWLPIALLQSHDVADGFWMSDITLGQSTAVYLVNVTIGRRIDPLMVPVIYSLFFGFTIYSLWYHRDFLRTRRGGVFLAVAVGVPLLTALISFGWHNVFLTRTQLISGLLIALLWSNTLVHSPGRHLARLVAYPVFLICAVSMLSPDAQRSDLHGYIEPCADADYIYSTSTNVAISTSYFLDKPIYLWENSNDLNQWLSEDAKQAFGFVQVSSPKLLPGHWCIPFQLNPLTDMSQAKHIQDFLNEHPYIQQTMIDKTYYQFYVFEGVQ